MVVYKNDNKYDTSNVAVENGMVTRYDKKNSTGDLVFIDYGVLVFNKKVLEFIPEDTVCPLEKIIHTLIQRKEIIAYETKKRFYEIGSHKGMYDFSRYIASQ
jgi:NDP-sugar pyrophosphorylase family protein